MKLKQILGLTVTLLIIATSCTNPSKPIAGNWYISSFVKDSVDITNDFNGASINCTDDGQMTIHYNGNTYSCNWNYNDAHNEFMCHFHIMGCDDHSILWELEEDWNVTYPDIDHCHFTSHNPNHHCSMIWTHH